MEGWKELHNLIEDTYERNKDKEMLRFYKKDSTLSYTYGDSKKEACQIVEQLKKMPIKIGDRIALVSETYPQCIFTILGCISAHFTVVILNNRLSYEEIVLQLNQAQVDYVIVDDITRYGVSERNMGGRAVFDLRTLSWQIGSNFMERHWSNVDETAMVILFSSGTTDTAKCVVIGYEQQFYAIQIQSSLWKDIKRYYFLFPMFHVSGLSTFLGCMAQGNQMAIVERLDQSIIQRGFKDFSPYLFGVIPQVYEKYYEKIKKQIEGYKPLKKKLIRKLVQISDRTRSKLKINIGRIFFRKIYSELFGKSIRILGVGGGMLDEETYRFFYALGLNWINVYATTEMNVPITLLNPRLNNSEVSVGKVDQFNGIDIQIHDPNNQGIGEVYVKSIARFCYYYNDPEATKNAFDGGYFKTGDIGRIDGASYLYLVGRTKESIHLSNGEKVSPNDIEQIYKKVLKGVEKYAVVGIRDKTSTNERPYLVIEGNNLDENILQQILAFSRTVGRNYRIDGISFVNRIPVNAMGKTKRIELQHQIEERQFDNRTSEESVQDTIIGMIQRMAPVIKELDTQKRFKEDLGLDSLEVFELIVDVENKFHVSISPEVDEIDTIGDLCIKVSKKLCY